MFQKATNFPSLEVKMAVKSTIQDWIKVRVFPARRARVRSEIICRCVQKSCSLDLWLVVVYDVINIGKKYSCRALTTEYILMPVPFISESFVSLLYHALLRAARQFRGTRTGMASPRSTRELRADRASILF